MTVDHFYPIVRHMNPIPAHLNSISRRFRMSAAIVQAAMRDFFPIRGATDVIYRVIARYPDLADHVRDLWRRSEPYLDTRRPHAAAQRSVEGVKSARRSAAETPTACARSVPDTVRWPLSGRPSTQSGFRSEGLFVFGSP